MAFNMKIIANANDVSFSSALITGATAAIALPPHIAVPVDIKYAFLLFIFNNLPNKVPINNTPITETMVKIIPSLPVANDSCKFMPKPNPTTDTCNKYFEAFFEKLPYGTPMVNAMNIPKNNAIAGETNNETTIRIMKMIRVTVP